MTKTLGPVPLGWKAHGRPRLRRRGHAGRAGVAAPGGGGLGQSACVASARTPSTVIRGLIDTPAAYQVVRDGTAGPITPTRAGGRLGSAATGER